MGAETRRFERFLMSISGKYHNNCTEVRPDTKGASYDEVQRSERIYGAKQSSLREGYTQKGVYRYNYKLEKEVLFEFKSRGKLREKS